MVIALVGEAPNDTDSIANLLSRKYDSGFDFIPLLNRTNGSDLDSQKTKRLLRNEYEFEKRKGNAIDVVIFVRDLDGLASNSHQRTIRDDYFTNFNSVVDRKGIYLLNIYEIEALILADIKTFNAKYNTTVEQVEDSMLIEEPKEFLRGQKVGYFESHNPEIFGLLDFETVYSNCNYFSLFIDRFNRLIKDLR
ncbi:hypothetical protein [Neptunitalea lumnitzerae]|uniref:DUF4276 family protein n=1 Tax=Neptunitalea lumnitzerae TaxID=2965509 RepID=A0ABQ5MHD6_9FLAO|nr:hypothetical protein [Neptunitalea sp. Y10]GLB48716.1 hypothetical protein Y10_10840 [Neptunitalea sp. Y10]